MGIEIYKGVCSYQKYLLENIGYREFDIACTRMTCKKGFCGCIDDYSGWEGKLRCGGCFRIW